MRNLLKIFPAMQKNVNRSLIPNCKPSNIPDLKRVMGRICSKQTIAHEF